MEGHETCYTGGFSRRGVEGNEGMYSGFGNLGMWYCKERNGAKKRMRWWNEEVQLAVRKMMYKKMLVVSTDEARQRYNKAKIEAGRAVKKMKMMNGYS